MIVRENHGSLEIRESAALFPLIHAVADGLQRGWIVQDRATDPDIMLLLGRSTFGQIALCRHIDALPAFLKELYSEPQVPTYFHIYDPGQPLLDAAAAGPFNTKVRSREQFRYTQSTRFTDITVSQGYTLQPLGLEHMSGLAAFNLDLGNRFWSSEEDLLKNGYGICCITAAGTPVALCYSACVAGGVAEIDVFTLPEHRGKGLAEAASQAFVNASLERGIVPGWDCFTENTASLRIPQRLGFTHTRQYTFLSLYNGGRDRTT